MRFNILSSLTGSQSLYRALQDDRRGFGALVMVFTIIPLLTIGAMTIGYAQMSQNRAMLAAAADSAALVATTTAANAYSVGTDPNYITTGQQAGVKWFNTEVSQLNLAGTPSVAIQITQSKTVFNTTLNYSANQNFTFSKLFGTRNFSISGQSYATITVPGYLDIHVLMDVSSSMDIVAAPNDVYNLWLLIKQTETAQKAKNGQDSDIWGRAQGYDCAFACHYYTATDMANLNTPDLYNLAKQNGIQLRVDVMRTAVENLIQSMINANAGTNFRVGLYEFNTTETTLYGISTDLKTALSTAEQIDTPVTQKGSLDTNFEAAMTSMNQIVQNGGDGMSQPTPKEVMFIISDGIDNNPVSVPNQGPFNASYCTALKNRGVRIEVLYTQYYTVYQDYNPTSPTDHQYYNGTWYGEVLPNLTASQTALQNCASSAQDYFVATDGASINAALQQMLQASLAKPGRYTK